MTEGVTICLVHPAYRCFSFGIGSGASTHLVKGIAQAGLGTSEFITSGERMQPKVCERELTIQWHSMAGL